jgi:hypothetical protein
MPEGTPTTSSPAVPVAGLCTLYELQESVFDFLRDTERIFITEDAVKRWLNEAYVDLNARLRLNQQAVVDTTDDEGVITPPDGFLEMVSLWIGDTPVTVVDDTVFESYFEPSLTSLDFDTIIARFYSGVFQTYPVQDTVEYKLRYIQTITPMVDLDDQPTALTPELCVRLRKYALAEAWTKEGETERAAQAMQEYLEGLPSRPRLMHRMRPAPVTLIPAPGPFG